MKKIIKNKFVLALLLAVSTAVSAQAQELKTDVSVSKQFVDGSVPGLKYASPTAKKPAPVKVDGEGKETTGMQFKKGTIPGMTFAHATGTGKKTVVVKKDAAVKLPSEAAPVKITTAKIPAAVIPTQEEKGTTQQ